MACLKPYTPIGTLKPVAEDVWIIDGPEIGMRYFGLSVPFTTRATVVRLPDGSLWVHSPVALDSALAAALDALGPVAHLVAPNTLYWSWIADWKARWPLAGIYAPPQLQQHKGFDGNLIDMLLDNTPPAVWQGVFEQRLVVGSLLSEVVFFHRPTRTLVLTDLIENFEPARACGRWRWLMRLFGAADPDGKAPYDMQLSFWRHRKALRDAVQQMIGWAPERVLFAHGRWYPRSGVAELRRAFRWVL
ncbi:MAG: DUF4336 domain-containing protein [Pseudomonadota bacterium]|nr:DUF4336 domain-containing protein [Pseudomonadota bacterium]